MSIVNGQTIHHTDSYCNSLYIFVIVTIIMLFIQDQRGVLKSANLERIKIDTMSKVLQFTGEFVIIAATYSQFVFNTMYRCTNALAFCVITPLSCDSNV